MKRIGLIWILFQLDTTLPIQLSSNYPYQLPPSNLINTYLSEWQAQHEALRKQWNEQEREREIDKQKQENVKSDAKPKLKLTNPAALRLEQQPLSSQPRVQAAGKAQDNLQPAQNAIQSPSQSLALLAPDLGEQLEKLKQSPILQDKNNRALFQNSNGCACMPNDYACNNECVQQRMLQQASSVIGCMTACAAQSIGAIQNCMLGCSNVYYAQVTAPVPTPVTETPSPSSSTNAPSSTQQQSSTSSSETPATTTSSSQESSTTSTSSDSSTTTDSSSSTTPSETTTPTSSQSSTSSSPTPTNSGNPNINGTVDGTDDDDDDDSALTIGAKHTLIAVTISTLLTLFVI